MADTSTYNRYATWPNAISSTRLVIGAPALGLLFWLHHPRAAGVVLLAAGASDWYDGRLARRTKTVIRIGEWLDPVADRAVMAVACIGLLAHHEVPHALVWALLVRDVLMTVTMAIAYLLGHIAKVLYSGKAAHLLVLASFGAFLILQTRSPMMRMTLSVVAVVGLLLAWWTFLGYITRMRKQVQPGPLQPA